MFIHPSNAEGSKYDWSACRVSSQLSPSFCLLNASYEKDYISINVMHFSHSVIVLFSVFVYFYSETQKAPCSMCIEAVNSGIVHVTVPPRGNTHQVLGMQKRFSFFQEEEILLFSNGILKLGGEREPVPRGKKWPLGPFLAPDAQFIPDISVMDEPVHLQHSDLDAIGVCLDLLRAIRDTVKSQYKGGLISES